MSKLDEDFQLLYETFKKGNYVNSIELAEKFTNWFNKYQHSYEEKQNDQAREAFKKSEAKKLAVSPLINGKAVKGPAEKIMNSLGLQSDAIGIAKFYEEFIDTILIDNIDRQLAPDIESLGLEVFCTDILMSKKTEKKRLAAEILQICETSFCHNRAIT